MDKQELIEFYNKYKSNIRYKSDDQRYKLIIQLTSFLDNDYTLGKITFTQRIWHIKHDEYNVKICKFCGRQVKWRKDIKKINKCYSKDITLIVVWENDWINNKRKVQSLISKIINTLS